MSKANCLALKGCRLKDRRSGKDRRRTIDPRYRNPAYPEFVDRRKSDRRGPVTTDIPCLVSEHPNARVVNALGILAGIFLLAVIFLATAKVEQMADVEMAAHIFSDNILPYLLPWSF